MRSSQRTLRAGLLLLVVGAIAFGVAAFNMKDRLADRRVPIVWFPGDRIIANEFDFVYERAPDGSQKNAQHVIIRAVDPEAAAGEKTAETLRIHFRGQTFDLPVTGRDDTRLPGLERFNDWLLVSPMVDGLTNADNVGEAVRRGDVQPRLIVVARYPAPGFDPDTWGAVRRSEWEYWFVELKMTGPDDEAIQVTTRSYRALQGIAEQLLGQLDEVENIRDIRQITSFERLYNRFGDDDPSDNHTFPDTPLVDLYWQYQAMLYVTPQLQYPRTQVTDYGLRAMGWTWPVAGVGALAMLLGIGMVAASRVGNA